MEYEAALGKSAQAIGAWQSGDLLHLSAIEECLEGLLQADPPPFFGERRRAGLRKLISRTKELLDASKEAAWLRDAGSFLSGLAGQGPGKAEISANNEVPAAGASATSESGTDEKSATVTETQDKSEPERNPEAVEAMAGKGASQAGLKALSDAAGERGYPDGYFSGIIEDPKMLGQLCDEVKEHLDTAQFSLVDLEYDPLNPENINKIFRAFHTIKSSSAFLGLKNVEEVAHIMEDLLVIIRDGALAVSGELTDVIFYGIGLLKDLVLIIETADYKAAVMVESFKQVNIHGYIRVIQKILANYTKKKIGEILQEEGKLDRRSVEKIVAAQKETKRPFGEIALEQKLISEEDFRGALQKQASSARKASYVKVSNERLNALIDIVGELVVNQSMLRQYLNTNDVNSENGDRTVCQLESITTSMKNLVLSMGMVPIGELFNKLRVVVRNTATETGKTVLVDFSGDDTELDRNVIESIYDPLVHIVRNAVDHGIEPPNDRQESGKNRMGRISIAAEHKGNGIEISVSDDGRGINRSKVLAKAMAKGLISEDAAAGLGERETYSLLFLPGFSTAEKVTEVSGRGVGLDVVKKNVDQIHGKVEILSEEGMGSHFIIRIPLTLAIIDGFVTMVDDTKYIFPFNLIQEILVPEPRMLSRLESGQSLLFNRGSYLPIIMAAELFGHLEHPRDLASMLVIVMKYDQKNYGIAVDSIVGKQEIVIKSLSEALDRLKVFSGGTIFGDGSIGFVVDIEEFLEAAREGESA